MATSATRVPALPAPHLQPGSSARSQKCPSASPPFLPTHDGKDARPIETRLLVLAWQFNTIACAIRLIFAKAIRDSLPTVLMKTTGSLSSRDIALHMQAHPVVKKQELVEPEQFSFKDDGVFPNSVLPVLLYRQAFKTGIGDRASAIEQCFAENDWSNSWRNGVYSFAHYHITTHEVLGVYCGAATLRLSGERSSDVKVYAGDVIVIPAGVPHQRISASEDFAVVGAYPDGREWDLLRGRPGERPKADQNTAAPPMADNDPIYGADGPLRQIWKAARGR